jgi:hypothetical protein
VEVWELSVPPATDLAEAVNCDSVIAAVTAQCTVHFLGVPHALGVPMLRLARRQSAGNLDGLTNGFLPQHYDNDLAQ